MPFGGMRGAEPISVSGRWNVMDRFRGDMAVDPIVATGGTITQISANGIAYNVHTFTSNGTFVVSDVGYPANKIEYFVLGGGAGGSGGQPNILGSGGNGGQASFGFSSVSVASYSVTVGGGGGGGCYQGGGGNGAASSIAGIASASGGLGPPPNVIRHGLGAAQNTSAGLTSLARREGVSTSINGSLLEVGGGGAVAFADAGSMGTYFGGACCGGPPGTSAAANTGGGGSGAYNQNCAGSGGSGIVIIRYPA